MLKKHTPALAQFIKWAYANAPAVQDIFDKAHVKPAAIKRIADLERIPVTTKDQLVRMQQGALLFGGFLAIDPKRIRRVFQSPGPIYEPHGAAKVMARVGGKVFRLAGFKRGDMVLNTLSYHLSPGGWILDAGLQNIGACVVPGGVGNTELQVRILADLQVVGYAGTPSFLLTILQKAEELGLDVRKQLALQRALFTGEPYPPSLRAQFENTYGLRTTNVYATAELGFLAFDCSAQHGLHFADGILLQICDLATGKQVAAGQVGQIVVTSLDETYPLIRFGTGDLATYLDAPCPCGRASPRLALVGRIGDAVKVRGMFVHPNQLKSAASKFTAIARIQGIVTRPSGVRDNLTLCVELAQEDVNHAKLSQDLSKAVREVCRVSVDQVQFAAPGTLAADAKMLVDERKWE